MQNVEFYHEQHERSKSGDSTQLVLQPFQNKWATRNKSFDFWQIKVKQQAIWLNWSKGVCCMVKWLRVSEVLVVVLRSQQSWWFEGEIEFTLGVTTTLQFLHWNWRILPSEHDKLKLVEQEPLWHLACPAVKTPGWLVNTVLWPWLVLQNELFCAIQVMVLLQYVCYSNGSLILEKLKCGHRRLILNRR